MLENPKSFLNHNVIRENRRDGLKIKEIGQSAVLIILYKKVYMKDYTIERILDMLNSGMLVNDIAHHFNVNRGTISKVLKKHGYNMRNHKGQTAKQSKFMTENNPVPKGSSRDKKILEPMFKAQKEGYLFRLQNVKDFKTYAKMARHYAYNQYNKQIPEGLVIDHKFSIADGWKNNVPIHIVSHKQNLRLVTETENLHKGANSSITIDQLYKTIGIQRLSQKGVG